MDKRRSLGSLPDAPESFEQAIYEGSLRIRQYERRKKRLKTVLAAACFVAILGTATLTLRPEPMKDVLAPAPVETAPREVWTHPDDTYYHRSPTCELCLEGTVQMQTDTAMEFGKEACPKCFGN